MNIKICPIGFNEIHGLKRLIPNLLSKGIPAKDIYFFDGPFEDFKSDEDYSTDGSLEYLKEMGCNIVACGRMNHMDKQNHRFHYFKDVDALFFIDCDEYINGNWQEFKESVEAISELKHNVVCTVPWTDFGEMYRHRDRMPTLFLFPNKWHVEGRHWHFYYEDSRVDVYKQPVAGGIHMYHDDSVRPSLREKQMDEFQKIHVDKEKKEYEKINKLDLPTQPIKCYPCGCSRGYAVYIDESVNPPTKKSRWIQINCKKHSIGKKPAQCNSRCIFQTRPSCISWYGSDSSTEYYNR